MEWLLRRADTRSTDVLAIETQFLFRSMIFTETELKGVYLIETEPLEDDRGFFARTFCREEFAKYGLNPQVAQCNLSYNRKKGTLRGMHYQIAPREEAKLVRCISGAIYDVIVDLREDSTTYCQWLSLELSARGRMLYIPEGCGHGYLTLAPNTDLVYQASAPYAPGSAKGVRYDDPAFNIVWPGAIRVISLQDQNWPRFSRGAT